MQQRTVPILQQISQIEDRLQSIGNLLLDNVKSTQILRSNYTSMMHDNKKLREDLSDDILKELDKLRANFNGHSTDLVVTMEGIDHDIKYLKGEKRKVADGIMLLDRRTEANENTFGSYHYMSEL